MLLFGHQVSWAPQKKRFAHKIFSRVLLASITFLSLLSTVSFSTTLKEVEQSQIHNFRTFDEADRFAVAYAQKIKAANAASRDSQIGTKENPIRLYHVHKTFSKHIERAILKLVDLGIVVESHLINPNDILEDITDIEEIDAHAPIPNFMGLGDYETNPFSSPAPNLAAEDTSQGGPLAKAGVLRRMGNGLRHLFKIPGGFTLWTSIPRGAEEKKQAARLACINATTALCSIAISFSLAGRPLPEIMGAAAGLWVWVWTNMYWFRSLQEVMAQGKTLDLRDGQVIGFKRSMPFLWSANFVRGLLTNSMILLGRFGFAAAAALLAGNPETAMASLALIVPAIFSPVSIVNAIINVFARSQVDKWITERTPSPKDPPDAPGKFSVKKATRLRAFWEFAYGMIKNLDLVKTGSGGGDSATVKISAIVYRTMVVISSGWLILDLKSNFKSEWIRTKAQMTGTAPKCEAFLVIPKTLGV